MNTTEKLRNKYRLGLTIQKFVDINKSKNDGSLITSLRKLAAASGTEYSIIQKITSGKKDPQFSTLITILDGLGLNLSQFANLFDSISYSEISEYKDQIRIKQNKRKKIASKKNILNRKP